VRVLVLWVWAGGGLMPCGGASVFQQWWWRTRATDASTGITVLSLLQNSINRGIFKRPRGRVEKKQPWLMARINRGSYFLLTETVTENRLAKLIY
jgi:hypothetical protein